MARYWCVWKGAFPNFVAVSKPRVNLTCTGRNYSICVFWLIFLCSRSVCPWLDMPFSQVVCCAFVVVFSFLLSVLWPRLLDHFSSMFMLSRFAARQTTKGRSLPLFHRHSTDSVLLLTRTRRRLPHCVRAMLKFCLPRKLLHFFSSSF